ncbi:hypothetical protein GYMLUDRAFT_35521 [Collybiopsis luxurians FD-317 M1]|nr:hypothetical protein GYMLUDRAFT_35521 [Collybiopsis luxurians FD-317 M1]
MSNSTDVGPTIPFQLLPPSIALQTQIDSYIDVASTAIFIWDILSNVTADWKVFHTAKNKLLLAVYVISRIGALTFVLGRAIFGTYPIGNCNAANIVIDSFYPVGIAGSCLLFFFRARAVYQGHRYVIAFFAFLWVTVLGACIVVPFGTVSINNGPTKYCVSTNVTAYTGAAVIVPTVHDTIVFLAVSFKLTAYSFATARTFRERLLGTHLPAFTKAMFRDGQTYYLITVLGNLLTISLMYAPVNGEVQTALTIPNVMLTNVMACYVYRHLVLSRNRNPYSTGTTDANVIPTQQNVIQFAAMKSGSNDISTTTVDGIRVEMTQVTHMDDKEKQGESFSSV